MRGGFATEKLAEIQKKNPDRIVSAICERATTPIVVQKKGFTVITKVRAQLIHGRRERAKRQKKRRNIEEEKYGLVVLRQCILFQSQSRNKEKIRTGLPPGKKKKRASRKSPGKVEMLSWRFRRVRIAEITSRKNRNGGG